MKKCLFGIIFSVFSMLAIILSSCNANSSEDTANQILKQYGSMQSEFIYYNKDNLHIEVNNFSQKTKDKLWNMTDSEKVLHYTFTQKQRTPVEEPIEISALLGIWLHLKENSADYQNILAVYSSYRLCNLSFVINKEIIILRDEFEELLAQVSSSICQDEIITKLTELWVKKYHYNRLGLDGKWKNLLTPWCEAIYSESKQYSARFAKEYDKFEIMQVTYKDSGSKISESSVFSTQFTENGHLYGVWDSFNFWIWGETSGLKYFEYIDEKNWVLADNEELIPPVILQEIIKVYQ